MAELPRGEWIKYTPEMIDTIPKCEWFVCNYGEVTGDWDPELLYLDSDYTFIRLNGDSGPNFAPDWFLLIPFNKGELK